MCEMNVGIVMPNLAALRAAVFTLFGKKPQGGGNIRPPPDGARVLMCFVIPLAVSQDFAISTHVLPARRTRQTQLSLTRFRV